jgi:1,2-diacylglycerol 3-beta-galactosyltransferase
MADDGPGARQHDEIMPATQQAGAPAPAPLPVLFLMADTGGGHRNAARAVGESLELAYPGRFAPVLCDPLGGPGSSRLLRWVTGLYGPVVRLAPWLWGAAYYATNLRPAMWLLRRTLLRPADRVAAGAARTHPPAAIVSFHPLTGMAAVWARDQVAPLAPVVTVVTDLTAMHAAWRYPGADLIIAPSAVASRHGPAGGRTRPSFQPEGSGRSAWAVAGPPVRRDFDGGPLPADQQAALRRSLGLATDRFVVLLTGGAEGSGGLGRRAAAILRRFTDVHVVVVGGRNTALKRRLGRLALRSGGRLTVTGFAGNMSDWLRCCDLVVTKAGPGTIAEATCCGVPLLLTAHVPGQEKGNSEMVTGAGAGLRVTDVRRLVAEIGRLRLDHDALEAMGAASARLGQPDAAGHTASLIAGLIPASTTGMRAVSCARL